MERDPKARRRLEQLMATRRQEVSRLADTRSRANPALRQLRVAIPEPPPITQQMLADRYMQRLWEVAERTPFEPWHTVDWDDEVQVQFEMLVRGRTVNAPRSVKMRVQPIPLLPGLAEVLLGMPIGMIREDVSIQLPPEYPDSSLRNLIVGVVIRLEDAWKVHVPFMDSPEAIERMARGPTLDAIMQSLYVELAQEQVEASWRDIQEQLLDALVAQTPVYLHPGAVDEELRRRFADSAEAAAIEDPGMREAVLAGWLQNEEKRAATERRLRIRLAMEEVAKREGVTVTEELKAELLRELATSQGISEEEARALVASDPAVARQLEARAWEATVIDYLVAQADIVIGS